MPDYLLDTNHVTHLLSRNEQLVEKVRESASREARFSISITVLGELYFAVYASRKREENLENLRSFLEDVALWAFDEAVAEEFGRIQAEQKKKGRPIPPTDSQIAAVCRIHGLTLLSDDHHFQFVEGLEVENWLSPVARRRRPALRAIPRPHGRSGGTRG